MTAKVFYNNRRQFDCTILSVNKTRAFIHRISYALRCRAFLLAKFGKEKQMYTLKTKGHFDAAHFLKGYRGKCANLHGHRWTVTAEIQGASLQTDLQHRGMLVDFGDLKKDLSALCGACDHCLIYEDGSLSDTALQALNGEGFRLKAVPFRPTAENLAAWFAGKMADQGYDVRRVEVYETPDNMAAYEPERNGD